MSQGKTPANTGVLTKIACWAVHTLDPCRVPVYTRAVGSCDSDLFETPCAPFPSLDGVLRQRRSDNV